MNPSSKTDFDLLYAALESMLFVMNHEFYPILNNAC
jgi:hypothetical protein